MESLPLSRAERLVVQLWTPVSVVLPWPFAVWDSPQRSLCMGMSHPPPHWIPVMLGSAHLPSCSPLPQPAETNKREVEDQLDCKRGPGLVTQSPPLQYPKDPGWIELPGPSPIYRPRAACSCRPWGWSPHPGLTPSSPGHSLSQATDTQHCAVWKADRKAGRQTAFPETILHSPSWLQGDMAAAEGRENGSF